MFDLKFSIWKKWVFDGNDGTEREQKLKQFTKSLVYLTFTYAEISNFEANTETWSKWEECAQLGNEQSE